MLTTHNLSVGYKTSRRSTPILEQINVTLRAGELTCLIGPNGAGKSTLMRTLAGMQSPLAGKVCLDDEEIHRMAPALLAKRLAVVLTERIEAGNLSAYTLVSLGRHPYTDWHGRLNAQDEQVVRQALTAVGASHLAARPVSELSDGERQKVMIARALSQEPAVLLLDEPTAFLDLPRRVEIMQLLHRLAHTGNKTILLSTHDLDLAMRIADRLWLLPNGGKLVEGLPEELALNGAISATFQSEGVTFDREQGSFKVERAKHGVINVNGQGSAALWTVRALERMGFDVVRDAPQLPGHIEVVELEGAVRWVARREGEEQCYGSLSTLLGDVTTDRHTI